MKSLRLLTWSALGGATVLSFAACSSPAPAPSPVPAPAPAVPASTPAPPRPNAKPAMPAKPAAAPAADAKPRPAAAAPALPVVDVPGLLAQATHLKGRQVVLTGTYAGWSGGCQGGPPISRSDWMVEDRNTGTCVYASGPAPQGIPMPPQPASIGLPVRVTGVVKLTPDGRPFLRVGVQP